MSRGTGAVRRTPPTTSPANKSEHRRRRKRAETGQRSSLWKAGAGRCATWAARRHRATTYRFTSSRGQ
eukprot:6779457-Prymnesium_polylepis.1